MRVKSVLCLIALLCCLVPVAASAQTVNVTSGAINGIVTDSSGGVLPGVSVTATSLDTGLVRTVTTEKDGKFIINLLPPGKYRVDAELSGLGKARVASVDVLLGNATRADLKIAPQLSETVEVSATSVDSTRTGAASSVTSEQIANLPILGRDFRSLAALTPGIVDAFGGRVTANGARGIATDYNIDGATSNNDFFGENTGGTRAPFTFSQAAIREFQVVRSQYDAEYGRGVGAQVNAITKSGTNDMHGEGFFFRRNRAWATSRPTYLGDCAFGTTGLPTFNDATHPTCRSIVDSFRAKDSTQGGFAVGGPVIKNQVFFFGNFDSQRQRLPVTPTDIRNLAGFAALTTTDQQALLTKVGALVGHAYDQELKYDTTFNQETYLGKVDVNLNSNNRLSVRNNYTNFENGNNQSSGQLSNQGTENDKFNQLVGQLTSVLSSRSVNEALVEFSVDQRPIAPVSTSPEIQLSVGSTSVFLGQNDFLPNNTKERKLQAKNTFRFTQGKHSLKVGGEAVLEHVDNLFPRNLNGVYVYSSVANYLADTPNSYKQGYGAGGGLTSWNQNTFAFFMHDNYRASARLTMDWGLRYDWQTMPVPAVNVFPQHSEFLNSIKVDRNNLAPRFGFAYDLSGNGKSVIRGGGGRFFGYMPAILMSNPLTQISGNFLQSSIANCMTVGIAVPCPTYPGTLSGTQFALLGATAGTDIVTVSPDYAAQEAWRSNVQYERQFAKGYSAAAGVIFSKMSNVQGTRNINAVSSGVALAGLPLYDTAAATRRYTDMGVVRELCSCETASYKAFTLETRKMTSSRFMPSWDASYTLASSIDEDSNERSTSTSFLWDPLNPALSQGPSDNDVRHRFVGNAIYRLPYGVQLSTIFQVRSGLPYNAGIISSVSGSSLNGLTQMTNNISVFLDSTGNIIDMTQANGFNRTQLAQFLSDRGATLAGRNTFRQPAWHNLDLRIAKTFDISNGGRHMQVQLIGEGFNLLATRNLFVGTTNQNRFRVNVAAGNIFTFTDLGTPTGFGVTSGYAGTPDPRQGQVAVKFIF